MLAHQLTLHTDTLVSFAFPVLVISWKSSFTVIKFNKLFDNNFHFFSHLNNRFKTDLAGHF